ncbi:hypothetical protein GCM10010519_46450 [Streptomyces lactacystinicus]
MEVIIRTLLIDLCRGGAGAAAAGEGFGSNSLVSGGGWRDEGAPAEGVGGREGPGRV